MSPLVPQTGARRLAQKGWGLLEFALVLVLLGVVAAMVLQGSNTMEGFHQTRFVQKVRTLEAYAQSFRNMHGRWPGDCNRDGLIDYEFVDAASLTASALDYDSAAALTQASSASESYALGLVCPAAGMTPFAKLNVNVPFNELKWAGLAPTGEPNRHTANHGLGGFAYLGSFATVANLNQIETRFNAIVLTQVPVNAARRLAVAIDGADGTAANRQRVRRTDDMVTFAPLWTAAGETQDKKITVLVFFDRVPPAGS